MENSNNNDAAHSQTNHHYDWQSAERFDSQWQPDENSVDLRSAEAGGYGIDSHDTYYASRHDDDKEANDEETAENDTDDDDGAGDWGDVDPQSGGFPTGNEPTAPGSAV